MPAAITTQADKQLSLFDYDALELIHRQSIQRATEEIRVLFRRSVQNYIKIGSKLKENHRRFPTVELFTGWFQSEFQGSQRTAYNLMQLADRFGDVDDETIAKIGLSTLYELAAASVPDSARQAALQLAGDGHAVTTEMAGAIIEQAKQAEETVQNSLFAVEPEDDVAVCLCGHRADRHEVDGVCDECPCEAYEEAPAGGDDVSIHKQVTAATSASLLQAGEQTIAVGKSGVCLCGHTANEHEDASNCKICNCECYETERVNHANVETLAEVTETTTTKTKILVEAAPVEPPVAVKGEGDILFEQTTINLAITIFPKKGDDRDCMVWVKGGEVSVQSMCKASQLQDAFSVFTLAQQLLALKTQLLENAEAKKKIGKTSVTTAATAKPKTTTKKGKK